MYGLFGDDLFTDNSSCDPKPSFLATKASPDHFVDTCQNTFGLSVVIAIFFYHYSLSNFRKNQPFINQ